MPEVQPFGLYVEKNGQPECIYEPQTHQLRYHTAETLNCIMEGGAGSGKSKAMRFDAYMRCLSIPRFRSLILRRSMPELRMSHLDEVPYDVEKMGLPKDAWHSTNFTLRFPNGSILVFGHVEDDSTIARFLSSEWDQIQFDELATFTLRQFLFLSSRARTTKVVNGVKLKARVGGGTNPVGPGSTWVRRYFITKDITPKENKGYKPENFEAQHSTVDDNAKYVDVGDYEQRLNALGNDALVRAMRHGEWVVEGQFFDEWREVRVLDDGTIIPWHVIEVLPKYRGVSILEKKWIEIVVTIDWGYAEEGNPGIALWWACLPDGSVVCFQEYVFKKTLPKDAAKEIRRLCAGMKVKQFIGDPAMFREHVGEPISETFAKRENGGISMEEADNERAAGWVRCHEWLKEEVHDGVHPRPKMQFLRSGCPTTIRTIPDMVVDPKNPEDMVTKGVEDDAADDMRYFVMSRPSASSEPKADPSTKWIRDHIAKKKRTKHLRRRAA